LILCIMFHGGQSSVRSGKLIAFHELDVDRLSLTATLTATQPRIHTLARCRAIFGTEVRRSSRPGWIEL